MNHIGQNLFILNWPMSILSSGSCLYTLYTLYLLYRFCPRAKRTQIYRLVSFAGSLISINAINQTVSVLERVTKSKYDQRRLIIGLSAANKCDAEWSVRQCTIISKLRLHTHSFVLQFVWVCIYYAQWGVEGSSTHFTPKAKNAPK